MRAKMPSSSWFTVVLLLGTVINHGTHVEGGLFSTANDRVEHMEGTCGGDTRQEEIASAMHNSMTLLWASPILSKQIVAEDSETNKIITTLILDDFPGIQ